MKLLVLVIMVNFLVLERVDTRVVRSDRPHTTTTVNTTVDPTATSTLPLPKPTKTIVRNTTIVRARVTKVDDCEAAAPDVELATFRWYIAVIFILILVLLACFDMIFLQLVLGRGQHTTADFIVFSFTTFVVIMNCFILAYLLKNMNLSKI